MKWYFESPAAVSRLIHAAGLWQGTPWMPNSDQVSIGVSCHNLPRAIYIACGALSKDFPVIKGDPNATRHAKTSVMVPFVGSRPEFEAVDPAGPLLHGDLLGLRIYHCVDHLGVYLGGGSFIHVLMHKKTDLDRADVPPWSQHIAAAWRIKV